MHRRKFIRDANVATSGLIINFPIFGKNTPSNKVVFGVSSRGNYLGNCFSQLPNVEIAYVCDVEDGAIKKGFEFTALSLRGTKQSLNKQSSATKKYLLLFLSLILLYPFYSFSQKLLFPQHPGVVSYTYRNYLSKDVAAGLDLIKSNGFTDIEFSSLFGKTAAELKAMLDERGLKCSSFGVSYDDLVNKTAEVAQNAKTLGAEHVRVADIPHKGDFTLANAQQAVADFNQYGKILKEQYGLSFIYHNHGFEFQPYQDVTLYDYLVTRTDPKYVSFELDILWAFFPAQDPAALLSKYGRRYKSMHLKDLKKGVATGSLAGGTDQDNDVALGTGQIDIAAVLRAAKKAGIKHYYIEDESTHVLTQVPQSIQYINSITQ